MISTITPPHPILNMLYQRPGRHYHTLQHIYFMLDKASQYNIELNQIQRLSIWWHDAEATEIESANLMKSTMIDFDPRTLELASLIIIDTQHKTRPSSYQSAIVCDLDLLILSSPDDEYQAYSQQIQKEYSHIPLTEYLEGRLWFLRSIMWKTLYHTSIFSPFESQAHDNILREILLIGQQLEQQSL